MCKFSSKDNEGGFKEAAGLDLHCSKNSLATMIVGVEARDG